MDFSGSASAPFHALHFILRRCSWRLAPSILLSPSTALREGKTWAGDEIDDNQAAAVLLAAQAIVIIKKNNTHSLKVISLTTHFLVSLHVQHSHPIKHLQHGGFKYTNQHLIHEASIDCRSLHDDVLYFGVLSSHIWRRARLDQALNFIFKV